MKKKNNLRFLCKNFLIKTQGSIFLPFPPPLRGGKRNQKIRNREEKSKEKRGETKMRKDRKKGKKGEKRNCKFLSTY